VNSWDSRGLDIAIEEIARIGPSQVLRDNAREPVFQEDLQVISTQASWATKECKPP